MTDFWTIVKAIVVALTLYNIGEGIMAALMDKIVGPEWRN